MVHNRKFQPQGSQFFGSNVHVFTVVVFALVIVEEHWVLKKHRQKVFTFNTNLKLPRAEICVKRAHEVLNKSQVHFKISNLSLEFSKLLKMGLPRFFKDLENLESSELWRNL